MKFTPSFKAVALTDSEKAALNKIANRAPVETQMCKRLKKLGLIQKNEDGWEPSEQGRIRLMFQSAH
jgi:hypothetical protein